MSPAEQPRLRSAMERYYSQLARLGDGLLSTFASSFSGAGNAHGLAAFCARVGALPEDCRTLAERSWIAWNGWSLGIHCQSP